MIYSVFKYNKWKRSEYLEIDWAQLNEHNYTDTVLSDHSLDGSRNHICKDRARPGLMEDKHFAHMTTSPI